MKKSIILILASFFYLFVDAQAPEGFNYQAVA